MAVRRTKKQKQKAEEKRLDSVVYSLSDLAQKEPSVEQSTKNIDADVKKTKPKSNKQLKQQNNYVKKDLFRTLVVTLVVVCVLIAYTIYYR